MKQCPRCGWELPDDSKFCTRCGFRLAEEPEQPETAEKKDRKKLRTAALAAAVLVLVLAAAAGVRAAMYPLYMRRAAEAEEAGDWEAAGAGYSRAVRLRPGSEEAAQALHELWLTVQLESANAAVDGSYEKAVETAKLLAVLDPSNELGNLSALRSAYFSWAEDLADSGDTDGALKVIEAAAADLPADMIDEMRTFIGSITEATSLRSEISGALSQAVREAGAEDHGAVMELLRSLTEKLDRYDSLGGWMPVVDVSGFGYIGAWSDGYGGYQIYAGDMDPALTRNGMGSLWYLSVDEDGGESWEFFRCDRWEYDFPGGSFDQMIFLDDSTVRYSGTLDCGVFQGDVVFTDTDGESYSMVFEEGIPEVLDDTDPDGNRCSVIGYNSDRSRWITAGPYDLEIPRGVTYIY